MKVLTSEQMRKADEKTIKEMGIPGIVLMENAGIQVVEAIKEWLEPTQPLSVAIIAGKGNNGGDGMVVARHLLNRGHLPIVFLLAPADNVKGDARTNLEIVRKLDIPLIELPDERAWEEEGPDLSSFDLIVDAIFGTGLTSPASGYYARVIDEVNQAPCPIVSVDIPSGLSGESSEVIGPTISADLTVTFAYPKLPHILPPACEFVGDLVVADISMPPEAIRGIGAKIELIEEDMLTGLLPPRHPNTHKGDYGHLLIVAGSPGKTGAAALAGEGALRIGAGLVTVACSKSLNPILEVKLTEVMTEPLPETEEQTISEEALPRLRELLKGKTALVIGPGLSRNEETTRLVQTLVTEAELPILIDADGVNAFIGAVDLLHGEGREITITPHPGEMARLLNISASEVVKERLKIAKRFAEEHKIWVVLKGYRTIIASPAGEIYINPTGNPGMASGGTGDVLSGIVGGLLAQGLPMREALILGVFLHGLAGDIAEEEIGEYPLAAGDLISYLPEAIRLVTGGFEEEEEE